MLANLILQKIQTLQMRGAILLEAGRFVQRWSRLFYGNS
jgi:hypothetical protein